MVFGPITLFAANPGEIDVALDALLPRWIAGAAFLTAALAAGVMALPRRATVYGVALLFSLGIAGWLQDAFLIGNYGLLDGTVIDWHQSVERRVAEAVLWIGLPVAAMRWAKSLASISTIASLTLTLLRGGIAFLSLSVLPATESESSKDPSTIPPSVTDFSATRNVIHVVLDAFQTDVFLDLRDRDPHRLDAMLTGFTLYPENAGAFPTTFVSIPAMQTGRIYRNAEPLNQFVASTRPGGSLVDALQAIGFDATITGISGELVQDEMATRFRMALPFISLASRRNLVALELIDISLFRHAPHRVKRWIYRDGTWRVRASSNDAHLSILPRSSQAFFEAFTASMTASAKRPTYKYIHLAMSHPPVVLDSDCEFVGIRPTTRTNFEAQASCTLQTLGHFLDRLRELGIYHNSLIVVAADHGAGLAPRDFSPAIQLDGPTADIAQIAGSAHALLLVKPIGERGPLKISPAPTAITDIPATVMSLLGEAHEFPGRAAHRIPANARRVRKFAYYAWHHEDWRRDYYSELRLFEIDGRLADAASWTSVGSLFDPRETPVQLVVDLDAPEGQARLGHGWSRREKTPIATFAWALGPEATLSLPLPSEGPCLLDMRFWSPLFNHPQGIEILIDGNLAAELRPGPGWSDYQVRVAAAENRPGESELTFRFARHRAEVSEHGKPQRPLAVRFEKIRVRAN